MRQLCQFVVAFRGAYVEQRWYGPVAGVQGQRLRRGQAPIVTVSCSQVSGAEIPKRRIPGRAVTGFASRITAYVPAFDDLGSGAVSGSQQSPGAAMFAGLRGMQRVFPGVWPWLNVGFGVTLNIGYYVLSNTGFSVKQYIAYCEFGQPDRSFFVTQIMALAGSGRASAVRAVVCLMLMETVRNQRRPVVLLNL